VIAAAVLMVCTLPACEPDAPGLRFVSASDPSREVRSPVAESGVTSVTAAMLGDVAGDLGQVGYRLRPEQRFFLFRANVGEQVRRRDQLLFLPAQSTRAERVETLDDKNWRSARVYDLGIGSWHAPYVALGGALTSQLAAAFSRDGTVPVRTVNPARLTPVLRSRSLTATEDSVEVVDARFRVGSIGNCSDVLLSLNFRISSRRLPGLVQTGPQCGSLSFQARDGQTWDHQFLMEDVTVRVNAPGCLTAGAIRTEVRDRLRRDVPPALEAFVRRDLLTIDPRRLGVDPTELVPCRCDGDCSGAFTEGLPWYLAGKRGVCMPTGGAAGAPGECWTRLELDRILIDPGGFDFVYAETPEDPQLDVLFTASIVARGGLAARLPLCESDRAPYRRPATTPVPAVVGDQLVLLP
jgi:hypothetical protein